MRLVAGNWKAPRQSVAQAVALAGACSGALAPMPVGVQIVVCPPFTALPALRAVFGEGVLLGAQDVFWEDGGAYTGEITAPMLVDVGCTHCIVGHSERRRLLGETDQHVALKLQACWRHGLVPILCVGETLQERQAGRTAAHLTTQVVAALGSSAPAPLAIAYEPIWAIGTGRAASAQDCAEGLGTIRSALVSLWGTAARVVSCLYGGSVTPENCDAFWGAGAANGALVGGASLDALAFAAICRAAADGGASRA